MAQSRQIAEMAALVGTVDTASTTASVEINYSVRSPFFTSFNTIQNNYMIPSNYNALSVGPTTVASGVTVTVSDSAYWVIV